LFDSKPNNLYFEDKKLCDRRTDLNLSESPEVTTNNLYISHTSIVQSFAALQSCHRFRESKKMSFRIFLAEKRIFGNLSIFSKKIFENLNSTLSYTSVF
jgi:hypothetical protein